jgi:hypothetical protein
MKDLGTKTKGRQEMSEAKQPTNLRQLGFNVPQKQTDIEFALEHGWNIHTWLRAFRDPLYLALSANGNSRKSRELKKLLERTLTFARLLRLNSPEETIRKEIIELMKLGDYGRLATKRTRLP